MLKTFIKHIIYEVCIDFLFEKIRNNFSQRVHKYKVGQKFGAFKIVWIENKRESFYCNVVIKKLITDYEVNH